MMTLSFALAANIVTLGFCNPVVTTRFGEIEGNLHERSLEFLGIPYAEKPDRFMEAKPWTLPYDGGRLKAKTYSPWCWQKDGDFGQKYRYAMSEDCLHLNIYTPRLMEGKLPVMLWIHPGALQQGSAMMPLYNGSHLAEQEGVVVVAINYRLGSFGFSPVKLASGDVLANHGFRDQREAMRWVRQHIASFGGDSSSITIFGDSAGGFSVSTHMLSRGSSGLFERAISESGDKLKTETLTDALNYTENLAHLVGCTNASDLTCLQQVDAGVLSSAYDSLGSWQAVIDGDVYEDAPLTLIKQGKFNHVPFINGNTENEGSLFLYLQLRDSATATEARCILERTFGAEPAKKVIQDYPLTEGVDNRPVLASIVGDLVQHCENYVVAQELAKAGAPLWVYSFKRAFSCSPFPIPGAYHVIDVPYVFNNIGAFLELGNNSSDCQVAGEDYKLAARVSAMWAEFARSGDAGWPRYGSDEQVLKIDLSTVSKFDFETGYRRSQCAVLAPIADYLNTSKARNQFNSCMYLNKSGILDACMSTTIHV